MIRDVSTSLDMTKKKKAYALAGVDVELGNFLKRRIQSHVKSTHGPEVLGEIGGFGGLFAPDFSGMREPVLVASIDGVGTKLKVAFALNRHDTVGADLVNHCVNDIAVLGARPLFFLDYIGAEKLEPKVFEQLLAGFAKIRFDPCIDGHVLPDLALNIIATGGQAPVPMLIGSTSDEGNG